MNQTAAFIMPLKISGNDNDIRDLLASIKAIEEQTDKDWVLIIVEDFSNDERVYKTLDELKKVSFTQKKKVIHLFCLMIQTI